MLTQTRLKELLEYDPEAGLFTWLISKGKARAGQVTPGCIDAYGYRRIGINRVMYKAHRLAWLYITGEWPKGEIDHKNSNRSDNRFCNLRDATRSQNGKNRRPQENNTGLKGVWWHAAERKWRASIQADGKSIRLGDFGCPTAAYLAYCRAAKQYHGEFARVA